MFYSRKLNRESGRVEVWECEWADARTGMARKEFIRKHADESDVEYGTRRPTEKIGRHQREIGGGQTGPEFVAISRANLRVGLFNCTASGRNRQVGKFKRMRRRWLVASD